MLNCLSFYLKGKGTPICARSSFLAILSSRAKTDFTTLAWMYGELPKRVKDCTVPIPADRRRSDEQKIPRDSSSRSRSF
jgi:hypothetical protein